MQGEIFEILGPVADLGWNSDKDFVLGQPRIVEAEAIVQDRNWSLYSLDLERNLAWFAELPTGFDLAPTPFVFREQRHLARRLLQVALDDLPVLAETVAPPDRVIFVFNIGRCGSTLISHVLNTCPQVWGLSEPVAFPRLVMQNYNSNRRHRLPRDRFIALLRACVRLQFRPPVGNPATAFAMKFHSQCLFQADLYQAAFPEAAFVFLYRDAIGWTKSWYQMTQKYGYSPRLVGDTRTELWNCTTAADGLENLRPYVDVDAAEVAIEDTLVLGWARNMEEYSRFLGEGLPFLALRYNEVNRDRAASLGRLFAHCGLPEADAIAGLAAFDKDSQAGDFVSTDVEAEAMTDVQVARLRRVLASHPRFGDPDVLLPDIHTRDTGA